MSLPLGSPSGENRCSQRYISVLRVDLIMEAEQAVGSEEEGCPQVCVEKRVLEGPTGTLGKGKGTVHAEFA